MNRQEIFDTVATHLFTQGEKAAQGVHCRYRTDKGTSCAIGCLIPDEVYQRSYEGRGIGNLTANLKVDAPEFFQEVLGGEENIDFLGALQYTHDQDWHWIVDGNMKTQLIAIAVEYELDYSVLDGLTFKKD